MKFTKNEKAVLKLLLDNGRISDVEMAGKMNISTQAVGKIRRKLEDSHLIEGYSCHLNYEKLGLNHFALVSLKIKDKFWTDMGETKAMDHIKNSPSAIMSCMPSSSSTSWVVLRAFKDAKEMDRYFHLANVRHHQYFETIKTEHFSPLNLLNNNPKELFKIILDDEPIVPESMAALRSK
jgi:Lrp/AsnC family transcriptional regulator, leucine-responsive regulatory protein